MQIIKLISIALSVASVAFIGCTKGDTGPAGPTGATGTANVMYSSWNALNMQYSTADSSYEQIIKADSLTQAVLDSGTVLTYIKITNTTTNTASIVSADKYMDIIFSVGNIGLYSYYNFTGLQFRYIIIPGGVRAGRLAAGVLQTYTKEQLRAMSYEEVMQLLERSKNE